jgi:hypothetical protein
MTCLALLIAGVLLQCFDQYSTLALIPHGGIEANPVGVYLMGTLGLIPATVAMKTLVVGIPCEIVRHYRSGIIAVKTLAVLDGYYLILLSAFNLRLLGTV